MVELAVGSGSEKTVLAAHEAILVKSPWFAEQTAALTGKVRAYTIGM
jgi:hypothetical protein